MTKPQVLALSIAAAGAVVAVPALLVGGVFGALCGWITLACAVASLAYLANRPGLLGKRGGGLVWWRALPVAPYLLAYAIAARIRRARRRYASWDEVAPGLYVGARVPAAELPAGLQRIVDLTAEIPGEPSVLGHPGYRSHPVLDGAYPHDEDGFLALLEELGDTGGGIYVHCVSGRGRAPTAAAALLLARGVVADPASALELVRKGRSVAAPTRSDVDFIERIARRLG